MINETHSNDVLQLPESHLHEVSRKTSETGTEASLVESQPQLSQKDTSLETHPSENMETPPRSKLESRPQVQIHICEPLSSEVIDKEESKITTGQFKRVASANTALAVSSPEVSVPSPRKHNSTDDFNMLSLIGKGAYSTVVLVEHVVTGKRYAMKVMEKSFLKKEGKVDQSINERDMMVRLNHPLIVKLHYAFTDEKRLYFVMDHVPNGTLQEYLDKLTILPQALAQFYAAEIALMLEYLHSHNVAHRDLKPLNLLVDANYHLKLCDFGTAKKCLEDFSRSRRGTFVGTANYVAPEIVLTQMSGPSADLWSFGCIIYQFFAGHPPFKEGDQSTLFEKILKGDYDFPPDFPPVAQDLCLRLMRLEKEKRLGVGPDGFPALKNHEFFKGINFSTLMESTPPLDSPIMNRERKESDNSQEGDRPEEPIVKLCSKIEPIYMENYFCDDNPELQEARRISPHSKRVVHIIREGMVRLRCGWIFYQARRLVLTEHSKLTIYSTENAWKGDIILTKPEVLIEKQGSKRFDIITKKSTYKFKTATEKQTIEWIADITTLLKQAKSKQI